MASTYLEVVQAERWVKANPSSEDQALQDALQQQPWDPSVKALTVVPQVLTMMSEKLDWTQKLGDAFLAQEKDTCSPPRRRCGQSPGAGRAPGFEGAGCTTDTSDAFVIVIQPTNPEVIYVPTQRNPAVVYGAWPYPATAGRTTTRRATWPAARSWASPPA